MENYMEAIEELKEKHGFMDKEIAKLIGVSGVTISHWRNGDNGISEKNKEKIKKICKIKRQSKFPLNISYLKQLYELNSSEMSVFLGLNEGAASAWEKGRKTPKESSLLKISQKFRIPMKDLIEKEIGYDYRKNPEVAIEINKVIEERRRAIWQSRSEGHKNAYRRKKTLQGENIVSLNDKPEYVKKIEARQIVDQDKVNDLAEMIMMYQSTDKKGRDIIKGMMKLLSPKAA